MRKYGLIGYPLGHSWSKQYFDRKFRTENILDVRYELFEMPDLDGFPDLIMKNPELKGMNVTIPYKARIIPLLDSVDPVAGAIGAVNCIRIERRGGSPSMSGFNTDAAGFEKALTPLLDTHHTRALILGTGGGAKAVAHTLSKLGIDFIKASRNPRNPDEIEYSEIDAAMLEDHLLVVNATPLGMSPHTEGCPVLPNGALTRRHLLFDLVYNPPETRFLKLGRKAGSQVCNGLDMLHHQAELAWQIWNETAY